MAIIAEVTKLILLALSNFFIAILLTGLILFAIARIGATPPPAPVEPIRRQRGFRRRLHY